MSRTSSNPLSNTMIDLEGASVLDPVVSAVAPVLDAVTTNGAVRDALQGRWLGHALHPLLVTAPIGAWMSASILDASLADEDAASLLVGAGIATAVPSALTGLAELATGDQRERRVGVVHAGANVVGLGLQVASLAARRAGNRTTGALLSAAAMSVVGAAGYLGGHLAVARDMGTKDPAFDRA